MALLSGRYEVDRIQDPPFGETIRQIISAGKVFLDSLQGNEPPAADQSKDPLILSGESAKTWLELAETWLACEQHIKEVERYKKLQGEVADKMKEILGDFKFCEGFESASVLFGYSRSD